MTNAVPILQDIDVTFNDVHPRGGIPVTGGAGGHCRLHMRFHPAVRGSRRAVSEVPGAEAGGEVQDIGWNVEKFLVGADGRILGRLTSSVEPLSDGLIDAR